MMMEDREGYWEPRKIRERRPRFWVSVAKGLVFGVVLFGALWGGLAMAMLLEN